MSKHINSQQTKPDRVKSDNSRLDGHALKETIGRDKSADTLSKINEEVMNNEDIKNMYTDAKVVFGYGDGSNGIIIIGEAPSRSGGNITSEPFTSKFSGKLLSEILMNNNIRKEECFISNVCFCSPPMNGKPDMDNVILCTPYLLRAIKVIKPKKIILLGMFAKNFLEPGLKERYNVYSLCHPAYVLRRGIKETEEYKLKFKEILKND